MIPQSDIFFLQTGVGQGSVDCQCYQIIPHGFGYVIKSAKLHRFHGRIHRPVTGHHNHDIVGVHVFDKFQKLQAIAVGHLQIGNDKFVFVFHKGIHRFSAIVDGLDLVTFSVQQFG
ncbi:MAG: hypothetical protein A4E74_00760 [Syntrophus sp. PtaB.Bin075]|nr:MAG: hypothetical protein A4E74_00760 [Syntrophus sp. PtaB.Bin075]